MASLDVVVNNPGFRMPLDPSDDPSAALDALAGETRPWLFGVRHHSPACASALPPLLDQLDPTAVAIELPEDLAPWIEWLGDPAAEAPLAVAAVSRSGDDLGFYPFADFSPELAAIRWARARGVPVYAIDLPSSRRGIRERGGAPLGIEARLRGEAEDSWEHLVEAPAVPGEPERVRRAALLYGWAIRLDAARGGGIGELDRRREAHMRAALARLGAGSAGARIAAVVGAFHAAALQSEPALWTPPRDRPVEDVEIVSSLIPYAFELLDERSGYPAGIRDPAWQERLWQTHRDGGEVGALVAGCLVEIAREVRARGLPASVADARAAAEVAHSLAVLRRLAAPGRRELVEAVQTALAQGELLGRGRIVARAMEHVLVGRHRGRLAPGTPRSGLAPHVLALLDELRLPRGADPAEMRLDPLRSRIDRRRHVALCRLRACGVPYGVEQETTAAGGVDALTTTWRLSFTPATEAMIELAGARGVTLRQAAAGALRAEAARRTAAEQLTPLALIGLAETAAGAGIGELVAAWLAELAGPRLAEATLRELIALLGLVDRIAAGHVVGLPIAGGTGADDRSDRAGDRASDRAGEVPGEIAAFELPSIDRARVLDTAVASVLGLAGSESLEDARSLAELVRVLERPQPDGGDALGGGRLRWSIGQLVETATPLIAGAASVVQVLIGAVPAEALSVAIGGWFDLATIAESRSALASRLRGALAIAGPLFEAAPVFLDEMCARIEQASDAEFLARAAALRDGFEALSTASRRRLLRALGERLGEPDPSGRGLDVALAIDPALLLAAADADLAGLAALAHVPRPGVVALPPAAPRAATPAIAEPAAAAPAIAEPAAASAAIAEPAVAAPSVAEPPAAAPASAVPAALAIASPPVFASAPATRAIPDHVISVRDRWRMILGHERDRMRPEARRAARALDELYGHGHGEGSRGDLGGGGEASFPTVRAWRDEIEAVFGAQVFEEVAAKAAQQGRAAALLELDPAQVAPSVELLEHVLALRGGLGEPQLVRVRALVRRIVDELVRELAVRVRPALRGALGARPTRRPTGALHLPRTIAANLARARVRDDQVRLVPERLVWRSRSRRHLDWRIVLVVDVSGSMEPSVIYAAMMAAILSAVPWIDVRFIAFSTEIVDLSDHARDPLALLLEISVGGGTHIAKGLRYARGLIEVPQRTLAILISDFEEGFEIGGLLAEVRALVESGVTCLGLAALDDRGAPRYAVPIAEQVVAAGMPIAALTPVELARWIGAQIR